MIYRVAKGFDVLKGTFEERQDIPATFIQRIPVPMKPYNPVLLEFVQGESSLSMCLLFEQGYSVSLQYICFVTHAKHIEVCLDIIVYLYGSKKWVRT